MKYRYIYAAFLYAVIIINLCFLANNELPNFLYALAHSLITVGGCVAVVALISKPQNH